MISHFGNRLKVILLVLCLSLVGVTVAYFIERANFTASPPYKQAAAHLINHAYIRQSIGEPVRVKLGLVFGRYEQDNRCIVETKISGPRGKTVAVVWLRMLGDEWRVDEVQYIPDGGARKYRITKDGIPLERPE